MIMTTFHYTEKELIQHRIVYCLSQHVYLILFTWLESIRVFVFKANLHLINAFKPTILYPIPVGPVVISWTMIINNLCVLLNIHTFFIYLCISGHFIDWPLLGYIKMETDWLAQLFDFNKPALLYRFIKIVLN